MVKKKLIRLIKEIGCILLIVLLFGFFYNTLSPQGIYSITYLPDFEERSQYELTLQEAFKEWKRDVLFIDVRQDFLFKENHVKNAISVPYFSFDEIIQEILPALKESSKIIVYCSNSSCNSSEVISKKIREFDVDQVFYFEGGYHDWVKAGYPIEKSQSTN
jgi:rhodanese-related sulfurtransferase